MENKSNFVFSIRYTAIHKTLTEKNMSSVIRCGGQFINGHLITIQRQCCRTKIVMPAHYSAGISAYDVRRSYYNFQWDREKQQQHSKPFGVFEIISIGCVSFAIYNWKRYISLVLIFL